jgi:hypothetical protein
VAVSQSHCALSIVTCEGRKTAQLGIISIRKNRAKIRFHVAHYMKTTRGEHVILDTGLIVGRVDKNLMRPSTGRRTVDVGDVSELLGKSEHGSPDENNSSRK